MFTIRQYISLFSVGAQNDEAFMGTLSGATSKGRFGSALRRFGVLADLEEDALWFRLADGCDPRTGSSAGRPAEQWGHRSASARDRGL